MTAAAEPDAIVASTVTKIEQGEVTRNDIEELRKAIRRNPEAIPFLNRSFLNGSADAPPPSGTVIVRYVGMVQDMLDTEYYLSEMNGIKTHYRDVSLSGEVLQEEDLDIAHKLAERQPLVVVPIPFASEWLAETYSTANANNNAPQNAVMEHSSISSNALNKRQAETMSDPPMKRKALGSTPDTSVDDDSVMEENVSPHDTPLRTNNNSTADWWPAGCNQSDPNHCPILAKVYYEQQEDTNPRLRLNEVVELVGVLSLDPMHADFSHQATGEEEEWNDFDCMTLPPPSLLPRLHVLSFDRVNLEQQTIESNTTMNGERAFVKNVLAKHVFDGNVIAAEALLMTLMSMAEREDVGSNTWAPMKTPNDTTLGCASLHLILPSEASCQEMSNRLQQVLEQLVPVVAMVNLSRDKLGKTIVSPAKNESGRLDPPSVLQLPKGSAVIIDESSLTEGRIEARAEETLRALASLTSSHFVPYRFEGMMNYQFEADYRVIVVSKGSSNKLLPCSMVMKLSNDMLPEEESQVIPANDCQRIRSYLAQCRCNTQQEPQDVFNVPLPKALLEQAQKDFVEKRTAYREKVEQQKRMQAMAVDGSVPLLASIEDKVEEADFHRWLTIARLQARSRLSGEDTENDDGNETWADTMRLDEAMRS